MPRLILFFSLLLALNAGAALAAGEGGTEPPTEAQLDAALVNQQSTAGGGAGGAPETASGGDAVPADQPVEATPPAGSPKPAYLSENQPFQLKDYEEPKPSAEAPWWQQALGFAFKLVLVVGLVFLSLGAIKKISGGRISLPTSKGRNLVVLETTQLGPQQAIHLISLGGERLLVVGAGPQGLTTLTEITDPAQMRPFLNSSRDNASSFNQVFDLESMVTDSPSDLFSSESLRDDGDPPFGRGRRQWPRS